MEEKADAELVALARAGDKSAFGQLVERYRQMTERVTLSMIANRDIAQQLVQESILQAYLSLDHLRDPERFKSWLYGIVLNVCRSYVRTERAIPISWEAIADTLRIEALPLADVLPDPQATVEAQEIHHSVSAAIDALSPKNRAATELFYYQQLSVKKIAAALGISVSAVKGRLHKSRKQLRARLGPVYPERISTKQRRKTMIEVTVADVVERTWQDERSYIAVLLDNTEQRMLIIYIGSSEGQSIAVHFLQRRTERPLTYTLVNNILKALATDVKEVCIETLQENIFYATVTLCQGDTLHKVDARPSDAINLALRTGSPIFVSKEVMEEAGIQIPQDIWETRKPGKGLESIVQEWEHKREAWEQRRQKREMRPPPTEEEIAQKNLELVDLVFGTET
jgi:RNA polymerase sigma factor (sigma-70 family)